MKYHCGILDERPDRSRTLNWIKRSAWGLRPPEIEYELSVWLAMPGFTAAYHAHVLHHSVASIAPRLGGFEAVREAVVENWMSATRDDCIALAHLRPNRGDFPLLCQLRALEDLKGMRMVDVAKDYGTTLQTIWAWRIHGLKFRGPLPSGFELLVS